MTRSDVLVVEALFHITKATRHILHTEINILKRKELNLKYRKSLRVLTAETSDNGWCI